MKKQTLFLALLLALSLAGWGQNPLPFVTIGGVDVFQSDDSITGPNISGHVSFDAETHLLTFHNATINGDVILGGWPMNNYVKMRMFGNNSIIGFLDINSDSCSIYGPGNLEINSPVFDAIYASRTPFFSMEENVTVTISAPETGINAFYDFMGGDDYVYTSLYINNSTLIVSAPTCTNLITYWYLNSCHIVEPADAIFDPVRCIILLNGEWAFVISNYLEIRPGGVGVPIQNGPECRIVGGNGGVRIEYEGKSTVVEVTDMQGRCVCRTRHQGSSTFIPLHPGFYIVKVGNHTKKVVVL